MGLFKKDCCIVFYGTLKGYGASVTVSERSRYRNEAGVYVRSEFGNIEYEVEVLDSESYTPETLRDVERNGFRNMSGDKRSLYNCMHNSLILMYSLDVSDIKEYKLYTDLRAGHFMLLCKVRM